MRRVAYATVAFLHLLLSLGASAQVTTRSTLHELGDAVSDVGYVWASPLRANQREWAVVGISAAAFGALLPLDRRVDRWIVDHPRAAVFDALAPFREEGGVLMRLATARHLVPISTALVLGGVISGKRGLREAGYGCVSAWGVSNTVRYAVYALVSRDRPSVADGDPYAFRVPGGEWNSHAFFAGHATNAFACAAFWGERFDLGVGEPALYATAALSALSRMVDRRHWMSDTFVGVVVGTAIGRGLAARYDRRESVREARAHAALRTAPVVILWRGTF